MSWLDRLLDIDWVLVVLLITNTTLVIYVMCLWCWASEREARLRMVEAENQGLRVQLERLREDDAKADVLQFPEQREEKFHEAETVWDENFGQR